MDRRVTPPRRVTSPIWVPPSPCKQALTPLFFIHLRHMCKEQFFFSSSGIKRQAEFYEKMTSNPVFTKRNVQRTNAYRFQCIQENTVVGCPWLISQISSGAKIFGHVSHSTELVRGSQSGGGIYGYRLKFWLFYGYRLIFFQLRLTKKLKINFFCFKPLNIN